MAIETLPFPDLERWQYETALDETVYIIRGRLVSPPQVTPYYQIDLLTTDNEPIELGMKVVLGTRYVFRGATEDDPLGVLFFLAQGTMDSDVPTREDLASGKVIMCYDTAI